MPVKPILSLTAKFTNVNGIGLPAPFKGKEMTEMQASGVILMLVFICFALWDIANAIRETKEKE